jgi:hypothetical protein
MQLGSVEWFHKDTLESIAFGFHFLALLPETFFGIASPFSCRD